jgi:toluene monooxygenase system protein E
VWSAALARYALAANDANRGVIDSWAQKWRPLAERAVDGLAAAFADAPQPLESTAIREQVDESVAKFKEQWSD